MPTLDLAWLAQLTAVVANPATEFTLETARRALVDAVPDLIAELTALRERADQAEQRAAAAEAGLTQIAQYPIGADWSAAEVIQRIARRALAAQEQASTVHYVEPMPHPGLPEWQSEDAELAQHPLRGEQDQ